MCCNRKEFWKDVSEGEMFAVGHCDKEGIKMQFPFDDVEDDEEKKIIEKVKLKLLNEVKTPPTSAIQINDNPYKITQDILPGMKVEVKLCFQNVKYIFKQKQCH